MKHKSLIAIIMVALLTLSVCAVAGVSITPRSVALPIRDDTGQNGVPPNDNGNGGRVGPADTSSTQMRAWPSNYCPVKNQWVTYTIALWDYKGKGIGGEWIYLSGAKSGRLQTDSKGTTHLTTSFPTAGTYTITFSHPATAKWKASAAAARIKVVDSKIRTRLIPLYGGDNKNLPYVACIPAAQNSRGGWCDARVKLVTADSRQAPVNGKGIAFYVKPPGGRQWQYVGTWITGKPAPNIYYAHPIPGLIDKWFALNERPPSGSQWKSALREDCQYYETSAIYTVRWP